ncbi:MAG: preprotein translocase subunit SecG [Eubacteriales bacterium]|nr:preprotein translocase subunit SecG [Eubacteriales bacterium]
MSMPFMGLSILQCIVAFLLIVVVLQQSKTASPITSSGSADTNSYWSKNKGRSKEGKLARLTIILGVIFFIVTLVLGFIK